LQVILIRWHETIVWRTSKQDMSTHHPEPQSNTSEFNIKWTLVNKTSETIIFPHKTSSLNNTTSSHNTTTTWQSAATNYRCPYKYHLIYNAKLQLIDTTDMSKPICFISSAHDGQKGMGWYQQGKHAHNVLHHCWQNERIYTCVKQANVAGPPAPVTSKLTAVLAVSTFS
jgi:hypothetical protein